MSANPGLAAWLQLCLTPGLGSSSIRQLLSAFGLPANVLAANAAELSRCVGAAQARAIRSAEAQPALERALAWLEEPGHAVITLEDACYPGTLLETPDPPNLLYACGRLDLLSRPSLAIVGSRNATAQGLRNAEAFARAFSQAGLTVVSGLAMGVDAAAHRGGLDGTGSTVAVLGTGIDIAYPVRNAGLFDQIAGAGLLLSEYPLGTPAIPHNFPKRNRIISGLAKGCLVIEAAMGSGSLITARAAADQGREVFALPGSIHSPLSKGCHALIKQGAKLVDDVSDVLAELGQWQHASTLTLPKSAPAASGTLLEHMGFDPVDMDALCSRAGLSADRVAAELLRLELDGRVATLPGGRFQRLS
jgi:DNA processing protein